jgi:hypothetical protein
MPAERTTMLLVTLLAALIALANAERKKIIIDTDIFSAVNDVGFSPSQASSTTLET